MEIIVQKFGGTSVSSEENRKHCINHIKKEINKGKSIVVVVSAMGRSGQPYATDTLLSLMGGSEQSSKREKDILLSTGELISASVFSSQLRKAGVENTVLTGGQAGIITNDIFGSALILDVVPKRVVMELKKGNVVVVPGFQGQTNTGEITTLGRGGSDTTAAALAASLKADFCDIFTDVEGIMTADPRVVKDANYLEEISYEDVSQMALSGASVVHPRAVELAMNYEIPMRIRSTFSEKTGTIVSNKKAHNKNFDVKEVMISGVVSNRLIHRYTVGRIHSKEKYRDFKSLFPFLKKSSISMDFINVTAEQIYFTVPEKDSVELECYLLENSYTFKKEEDIAKIAIVGNAINGVPGIMGTIVDSLNQKDVGILQTSDSHTTIWLLVREKEEKIAVQAIHGRFFDKD